MKLKKAQKLETALVTVLEFIRITAATNPKVTTETLSRMRISGEMFAPCVGLLVRLALKNAEEMGETIEDLLMTLRKKSKKRKGSLPANFFMGTASEFNVTIGNAKKAEEEETEDGDYDNDADDNDNGE